MGKIRINKLDAARRQIDAAIRMTFAGEDPVAIHSIIAAGHRIVKDICEQRGDIESYLKFTDWIAPGYEKEFWSHMNASANFVKHADRDADAIHEMDVETPDFMIAFSAKWYRDLGHSTSFEMNVFVTWWALQHPKVISPAVLAQFKKAGVRGADIETMKTALATLNRADRIRAGKLFLDSAKNSGRLASCPPVFLITLVLLKRCNDKRLMACHAPVSRTTLSEQCQLPLATDVPL